MKNMAPRPRCTILMASCGKQVSDPLLAAGKKAIAGAYIVMTPRK